MEEGGGVEGGMGLRGGGDGVEGGGGGMGLRGGGRKEGMRC